jgi:hypothetical protein
VRSRTDSSQPNGERRNPSLCRGFRRSLLLVGEGSRGHHELGEGFGCGGGSNSCAHLSSRHCCQRRYRAVRRARSRVPYACRAHQPWAARRRHRPTPTGA